MISDKFVDRFKKLFGKRNQTYIIETFLNKYRKIRIGQKKVLGEGGNAIVYSVQSIEDGNEYALKQLKKNTKEGKARFIEELTIMQNNWYDIEGVLPVCDCDFHGFWYTMPIAKSALCYIRETRPNIYQTGKDFLKLLETVKELHEKGITHRDIKPANIYWYNNRFYLGDFGLVDFPDNPNDFTNSERGLGAIFTIAPEMKRNPKNADGKKADVYSLAKTFWMLLTLDEKGYDGQYDYTEKTHALRLNPLFRNEHLVELEEMLVLATNPDPVKRLGVQDLILGIEMWIMVSEDAKHAQYSDWNFVKKLIFKSHTPTSTKWNERNDIVEILNLFAHIPASNHLLFADNGGLDLKSASLAKEEGCISLDFSPWGIYVVKPKSLHFECFSDFPSFDYLLLEVDKLEMKVGDMASAGIEECVVEDFEGHYVSARAAQYGVYDYESGKPLPKGARVIHRYWGGNLLLVMKLGIYNQLSQTYDGRHSTVTPTEFRDYIQRIINVLQREEFNKDEFKRAVESVHKLYITEEDDEPAINWAPCDYVKKNFPKWNFLDCLPSNQNNKEHTIEFQLEVHDLESFIQTIKDGYYYILEDGSFGKEKTGTPFRVYGRNEYMAAVEKINAKILKYVHEDGFDDINLFDNVQIVPYISNTVKPAHLFTKSEIESLMRGADDRVTNKLVIDELGYAKIINDSSLGNLYPVSHESWEAGNRYVGKYSTLSTLDETYNDSLACWLEFLQTGSRVYCDLNKNCDEKETIKKIKGFM